MLHFSGPSAPPLNKAETPGVSAFIPRYAAEKARTRLSSGVTQQRHFPAISRFSGMARSLQWPVGMNARKVLDGQPGATPVIRTDGKNVTFRFELVGLQDQLRLALRCDPNGNVWAAIVSETDKDRTDGQ
jgi:hypothetical protein